MLAVLQGNLLVFSR